MAQPLSMLTFTYKVVPRRRAAPTFASPRTENPTTSRARAHSIERETQKDLEKQINRARFLAVASPYTDVKPRKARHVHGNV